MAALPVVDRMLSNFLVSKQRQLGQSDAALTPDE
jgi:hypothetical protein